MVNSEGTRKKPPPLRVRGQNTKSGNIPGQTKKLKPPPPSRVRGQNTKSGNIPGQIRNLELSQQEVQESTEINQDTRLQSVQEHPTIKELHHTQSINNRGVTLRQINNGSRGIKSGNNQNPRSQPFQIVKGISLNQPVINSNILKNNLKMRRQYLIKEIKETIEKLNNRNNDLEEKIRVKDIKISELNRINSGNTNKRDEQIRNLQEERKNCINMLKLI